MVADAFAGGVDARCAGFGGGLEYGVHLAGEIVNVGLSPDGAVEVKMALRTGVAEVHEPSGVGGAEVELSAVGGGDDG